MQPEGIFVARHHTDAPGPPVVLVHGAPDRSKNFAHVVHRLADLPVTVYDRRGYGRSVAAGLGADGDVLGGFRVHADDLIEILDGIPSIVCAQSAGGAIAMLASTMAPELFLALGAWEPPMVPWMWWAGERALDVTMAWGRHADPSQLAEEFNRQILGDDRWSALRYSTREMLRAEGTAFRADMAFQAETFLDLDDLQVPFLVGTGTVAQEGFDLACHRRLAERAGAELFVGEGADHFAHISRPESWVEFVRATVQLASRSVSAS